MSRTFHARGLALAGLTLSTLLVLGCEPPPVVATSDRQQQTTSARIEGSVVVQGPARGNAVVFLYDVQNPPPPQGSGHPVAFALIPQEELFGSEAGTNSTGPFTAPFIFPLVKPGKYLLRGFIDTDTCRTGAQPCHGPDFIPWYNVTAEPNVGDVGGAAVDLATLVPRIVEVREAEDGTPIPVLGTTVSFSAATATVPVDRPAFEMVSPPSTIDNGGAPKLFKIRSRPISQGGVNLSSPAFLVRFMDENHDGVPDDANGDGVPELWPRIIVRKLADGGNGITDENDLDNNGELDATGVDYAHASAPADGQPDLVVLAAGFVPDALLPGLYDTEGRPRMDAVIPVNELNVAVRPLALDARNPSAPAPLQKMPSGRYAVIVLQSTGQSWRVPNELAPALAGVIGLPSIDSQGQTLQVP